MKVFIDLYTDEDVDVLVADLLRGRGFDVMTAREAQQLGRDAAAQLAYATAFARTRLIVPHGVHLDADVLHWFRQHSPNDTEQINQILRQYIERHDHAAYATLRLNRFAQSRD